MPDQEARRGQVVTFYSYKGGTGRSLALANVACALAMRTEDDRPVLLVDWDLEAPGLQEFFPLSSGQSEPEGGGVVGLFEMLSAAAASNECPAADADDDEALEFVLSLDLTPYIRPTSVPRVLLMPAGPPGDARYPARVTAFDWDGLHRRTPWLFRGLAGRWAREYAFTMVDSRTGFTDASGICTTLLPEKLVVVFTPNRQSLSGVEDLVRRATRYRRESSDVRPLIVFPLPSRIEGSEEPLRKLWRWGGPQGGREVFGYQPMFERLLKDAYNLQECGLGEYFDKVGILHVPSLAYGERIVVGEDGSSDSLSPARPYEALAEHLAMLEKPWDDLAAAKALREASRLVAEGRRALSSGKREDARSSAMAAFSTLGEAPDAARTGLEELLAELGRRYDEDKEFEAAVACQERLVVLRERLLGADSPQLADALARLADLLRSAGQLRAAQERAERALALFEGAVGGGHPRVRPYVERVAEILEAAGESGRASAYWERARGPRGASSALRIYLSSSFLDLKEHRDLAYRALRQLGHDVVAMEDYVAADARPLNVCLRDVAAADVYVGIVAWRYGHVPADENPEGRSITELEYRRARGLGKPCLLFLLDEDVPWPPKLTDWMTGEGEQGARIRTFRKDLAREQVVGFFKTPEELGRLVAAAATTLERRLRTPIVQRVEREAPTVPDSYREWLMAQCSSVELLGLRLKQGQAVRLVHVYVPLTTVAGRADMKKRGRRASRTIDEGTSELLLHRLGDTSLFLSGGPGTGKSTFCRWVAWVTSAGDVPAPDPPADGAVAETLPPSLRGRLPLLVRLKDFADAWPKERQAPTSGAELETMLASWIDRTGPGGLRGDLLRAHLAGGSALLLLDGVDEVAPAVRAALLPGLSDAVARWEKGRNRVLVTSRPYGLTGGDVRRLGLPVTPVEHLDEAGQGYLVGRWFRILADTPEDGEATAAEMLRQVRAQPWLAPLASNPLLLTAACIVYGDGKRLPQDRHELYDRLVETVLHNRFSNKREIGRVRDRLAVVAHGMHTGESLAEPRPAPQAIATHDEIDRMLRAYQKRQAWTEQDRRSVFEDREELISHTGLFVPQGEDRAGFYHLSFQEFFAAQRIADLDTDRLRQVFLERGPTPEWRNTLSFLFGKVLAASTSPERPVRVLGEVVERLAPDSFAVQIVAADCVEILKGRGYGLPAGPDARLRGLLAGSLRGAPAARERCTLGSALGRLGDPRFRADAWHLPDEPSLGFVEVPAGPFTMGSDKARDAKADHDEQPTHEVELPAFYIARWPVTVAQFRAFVEDCRFTPGDPDCLRGVPNHPVVLVSWDEALRYCAWLTETLRAWAQLPALLGQVLKGEGGHAAWQVTLPSEAEWEKAARGTDGRIYSWGPEPDPDKANYDDTGIGRTSTVGCFPGGASPYGVEELSGNVWEWTRSLWSNYPYAPGDGRENLGADASSGRVVRGGSFNFGARFVRAASRRRTHPDYRFVGVGFRVVVSPFSSGL